MPNYIRACFCLEKNTSVEQYISLLQALQSYQCEFNIQTDWISGSRRINNEYIDINGNRNAAFGHIYRGGDFPMTHRNAGEWRFMVRVYDKCNNNRRLGDDFLRITWNP